MATGGDLTCERDKAATRLTCVQCAVPICPQCLVRTPVGLKCPRCGAQRSKSGAGLQRRPMWAVPVVIVAVLLAVLGLPKLFSSKTSTEGPGTANPLASTIPQPVGVAGPELRARYARIGQEARDGDLAFTVASVDCGATKVTGGASTLTAQGHFCFLKVAIKNYGRGPAMVYGPSQALFDEQSRRFQADPNATAVDPDNAGQDFTRGVVVNPGNELSAVLVFDVPADVTPVVASFQASPGRGAYVNLAARA